MIERIIKLFDNKLKDKDKYYNKIINELVESNKQKDKQIQVLCETIKILNKNTNENQQIKITNKIKQIEKVEQIEEKEKTDKYSVPKHNFGEIKPIPKSLDLRKMIDRITQDSVRIAINNETKDNIINFGFENRYDYLYFKINLNSKNRIVLKK